MPGRLARGVGLLFLVCCMSCNQGGTEAVPVATLPSANDIQQMTASIEQSCKGLARLETTALAAEKYATVLDLLAPGTAIDKPLKWESFGRLTVVSKDGRETVVHLYLRSGLDSAVAWKVGDGTYHDGKNASEVEDAIRAACTKR